MLHSCSVWGVSGEKSWGAFFLYLYLIYLDSLRACVSLSSSWCADSVGSRCMQWNLCWTDLVAAAWVCSKFDLCAVLLWVLLKKKNWKFPWYTSRSTAEGVQALQYCIKEKGEMNASQIFMEIMKCSMNFCYTHVVCQWYFYLSISVFFRIKSVVNAAWFAMACLVPVCGVRISYDECALLLGSQ